MNGPGSVVVEVKLWRLRADGTKYLVQQMVGDARGGLRFDFDEDGIVLPGEDRLTSWTWKPEIRHARIEDDEQAALRARNLANWGTGG